MTNHEQPCHSINPHTGSSFDDFLREEGIHEECTAVALKRKVQPMNHPEKPRYSMLIQWSDENNCYVVTLPEWSNVNSGGPHTHGDTYIEAAMMGTECLEMLIKSQRAEGETLPEPALTPMDAALRIMEADTDAHCLDEKDEIERKWDDLLASPESIAFMEKMSAELDADTKAGRLIPGGFDGRGEFTEDLEAALKALISKARQGMMVCDQEAIAVMINKTLKSCEIEEAQCAAKHAMHDKASCAAQRRTRRDSLSCLSLSGICTDIEDASANSAACVCFSP